MVADITAICFGADRVVHIGQAVFVDKGTQPELRHNKSKIALLNRILDFLYASLFLVHTF